MTLLNVLILKIFLILMDGFRVQNVCVNTTVIMEDKLSSSVNVTKISSVDETSERWLLSKHCRKIFLLLEDETNNSTGAKMENQYWTEKGDDAIKIKKGIKFFW